MSKSRMFSFITKTWNPVKYCSHNCAYCWARRYGLDSRPILHEDRMNPRFSPNDFVFVCDLGDLFCRGVPWDYVERVAEVINRFPQTRFLLLTKNPQAYGGLNLDRPESVWFGVTLESNRNYPGISKAPLQSERIDALRFLARSDRNIFVSVEPVLDFDLTDFLWVFEFLKDEEFGKVRGVAVGYDNYGHRLPEPPIEKTLAFIRGLRSDGIKVFAKTLRPAWYEKHRQIQEWITNSPKFTEKSSFV